MKRLIISIFFFILSFNQYFAQKVEGAGKCDAYLIYKALPLNEDEKMEFEDSFDLEKEAQTWINSRRNLKEKSKELYDNKKTGTSQYEDLILQINDKSYDIDESFEIINETRKKIYLKYLKQTKKSKLSSEDFKEIDKLKEQAISLFDRAEEIRKRAYKLKDYTQTCQSLNNATDFENMGIKKLEKALKILMKI